MSDQQRFWRSYFSATYLLCFLSVLAVSFIVPLWMIPLTIVGCGGGLWFSWNVTPWLVHRAQTLASVVLAGYAILFLRPLLSQQSLLVLLLQLLLMIMLGASWCVDKQQRLQTVHISAVMLCIASVCLPNVAHPALQAAVLVIALLLMLLLLQLSVDDRGNVSHADVYVKDFSALRMAMISLAGACLVGGIGWLVFLITPKLAMSFNLPGQGISQTDFKVVRLRGLPVTFGPLTVETGDAEEFLQQEYQKIVAAQQARDELTARRDTLPEKPPLVVTPQREIQFLGTDDWLSAPESVSRLAEPQPPARTLPEKVAARCRLLEQQIAQDRQLLALYQKLARDEEALYAPQAAAVSTRLKFNEQELARLREQLRELVGKRQPVEKVVPQKTVLLNANDEPLPVVSLGSSLTPVQGTDSGEVLHRIVVEQYAPQSGDSPWLGTTAVPANVQKQALPVFRPPQVEPQGSREKAPQNEMEETINIARGIGAAHGGGMNGRLRQQAGEGMVSVSAEQSGEPLRGIRGRQQPGVDLVDAQHLTEHDGAIPGENTDRPGVPGASGHPQLVIPDATGEPIVAGETAGMIMRITSGKRIVEEDIGVIAETQPAEGRGGSKAAVITAVPVARENIAETDRTQDVKTAATLSDPYGTITPDESGVLPERSEPRTAGLARLAQGVPHAGKPDFHVVLGGQEQVESAGNETNGAHAVGKANVPGFVSSDGRGTSARLSGGKGSGLRGGTGKQKANYGKSRAAMQRRGQQRNSGQEITSAAHEKGFAEPGGRVILYVFLAISICALLFLFFAKFIRNACLWYLIHTDPNRAVQALYHNTRRLFAHSGVSQYDWMSCTDVTHAVRLRHAWSLSLLTTLTLIFTRARYGRGNVACEQLQKAWQVYCVLGNRLVMRTPWLRRLQVYVSMF